MTRFAALAAALLLALAAPAAAQTLGSISAEAAQAGTIEPDATGSVEVTVEIGCGLILEEGGTSTVTVTGESPAFTVGEDSFTVAPDACVTGSGSVAQVANLSLTPVEDAPGLVPQSINITAALGSATANAETTGIVGYRPGHSVEADITFPAEVTGGSLTFNVTLEYTGNARSMIMFPDQTCDGCSVSGLQPLIRVPPAQETIEVTFQAPEGIWEERTFEFRHFVHYLLEDGSAGDPQEEQVENWTFVQAEQDLTETEEGEDTPGPGVLAVLALVGAAFILRRR